MKTELKRILYVEDEEDIRSIAKISLEDIGGFTVKFCDSGRVAIAEAEAFKPDLLLLDVMMPGLDGPATLCELRKLPALKNTPVIFMTARMQDSEIAEYKKLGVVDVLPKPFEPMTLADVIRKSWANIS
jgi:two-component system OmpR family response regulator